MTMNKPTMKYGEITLDDMKTFVNQQADIYKSLMEKYPGKDEIGWIDSYSWTKNYDGDLHKFIEDCIEHRDVDMWGWALNLALGSLFFDMEGDEYVYSYLVDWAKTGVAELYERAVNYSKQSNLYCISGNLKDGRDRTDTTHSFTYEFAHRKGETEAANFIKELVDWDNVPSKDVIFDAGIQWDSLK